METETEIRSKSSFIMIISAPIFRAVRACSQDSDEAELLQRRQICNAKNQPKMTGRTTPKDGEESGSKRKGWKDRDEKPVITDVLFSSPMSVNVALPELDSRDCRQQSEIFYPQADILLEVTVEKLTLYNLINHRVCGIDQRWPENSQK